MVHGKSGLVLVCNVVLWASATSGRRDDSVVAAAAAAEAHWRSFARLSEGVVTRRAKRPPPECPAGPKSTCDTVLYKRGCPCFTLEDIVSPDALDHIDTCTSSSDNYLYLKGPSFVANIGDNFHIIVARQYSESCSFTDNWYADANGEDPGGSDDIWQNLSRRSGSEFPLTPLTEEQKQACIATIAAAKDVISGNGLACENRLLRGKPDIIPSVSTRGKGADKARVPAIAKRNPTCPTCARRMYTTGCPCFRYQDFLGTNVFGDAVTKCAVMSNQRLSNLVLCNGSARKIIARPTSNSARPSCKIDYHIRDEGSSMRYSLERYHLDINKEEIDECVNIWQRVRDSVENDFDITCADLVFNQDTFECE